MLLKSTLIGRLGQDPQLRQTRNGDAMCTFSVATNRRYHNADQELVEETTWISCASYGRQAEVIHEHLSKGSLVYVEGDLSIREYVDSKGQPSASLDVRATNVKFLDRREGEADGNSEHEPEPDQGWDIDEDDGEI